MSEKEQVGEMLETNREALDKITDGLNQYVEQLKKQEPPLLVDMALLNARFDSMRLVLQDSGAPLEIQQAFHTLMNQTLTLMAIAIDLPSLGGREREQALVIDLMKKGDELAMAEFRSRAGT